MPRENRSTLASARVLKLKARAARSALIVMGLSKPEVDRLRERILHTAADDHQFITHVSQLGAVMLAMKKATRSARWFVIKKGSQLHVHRQPWA